MADFKNRFSWSKSRASVFASCRWKYYLHYYAYWGGWQHDADELKKKLYVLRRLNSRQQWAGIAVHDAIARYLKVVHSGEKPDFDAIVQETRQEMRAAFQHSRAGGYWKVKKSFGLLEHEYDEQIPAEVWRSNWDKVERCLVHFRESAILRDVEQTPPDRWKPIDALDSFELDDTPVWAAPDLAYVRENGRLMIVDWKTGSPRREDRFQLAGYADFAEQRWGFAPEHVLGVLAYLETGELQKIVVDRRTIDDFEAEARASMDEMRQALSDPVENVADPDRFPRSNDPKVCAFCNFRGVCPGPETTQES